MENCQMPFLDATKDNGEQKKRKNKDLGTKEQQDIGKKGQKDK